MSHANKKSLIPTAWGSIAITEQGDPAAPAVLLSHSILASSMMWDEQLAMLAKAGWRAIAIDTRGHGQSSSTIPPYTMDELGLDIISILDALSIKQAHFVGLSLGGMIGFGLGIHHGN